MDRINQSAEQDRATENHALNLGALTENDQHSSRQSMAGLADSDLAARILPDTTIVNNDGSSQGGGMSGKPDETSGAKKEFGSKPSSHSDKAQEGGAYKRGTDTDLSKVQGAAPGSPKLENQESIDTGRKTQTETVSPKQPIESNNQADITVRI